MLSTVLSTFSFAACFCTKQFLSQLHCLSHLMFFVSLSVLLNPVCLTACCLSWWSLPLSLNIAGLAELYLSFWTLLVSLTAFCLTESHLCHLSLWNPPVHLLNNTFLTQHRLSHWTPPVSLYGMFKKSTHNWDEFSRYSEWHFIYFIFTRFNYAWRSGGKCRWEEYEGGREIECKPKVAWPHGISEERALIADAR